MARKRKTCRRKKSVANRMKRVRATRKDQKKAVTAHNDARMACNPNETPDASSVANVSDTTTSTSSQMVDMATVYSEPAFSTPVRSSARRYGRDDVFDFTESATLSPIQPLHIRSRPAPDPHADSESEASTGPVVLQGRRIVSVQHLFAQILGDEHAPFGCSFVHNDVIKEHCDGLRCIWTLRCKMCNKVTVLHSDEDAETTVPVKDAAVTGILAGGGGYSSLINLTSGLNMPCMTSKTYVRHERKLGKIIEDAALDSMIQAGMEEKSLAISEGRVDVDGIPLIAVIADGMWGKRSYKTKYDSLSGVASIVGARTRKVLFLSVRNRYCLVCALAHHRGVTPDPKHHCSKNWQSTATSMEADIVAEGFACSINMHGVKYSQLIADGDSSVYRRLLETVPYGPRIVEKIECKSHLLRNFCRHLRAIASTTSYPPHLRKLLNGNVLRLRIAVSKACLFRKDEPGIMHERVMGLQRDIRNSVCHVFGQHDRCASYFCGGPSGAHKGDWNFVPEFQRCGMWFDLQRLVQKLSDDASSLIHYVSNNQCEVLNSVTAKFLSGKSDCSCCSPGIASVVQQQQQQS